MKKAMGGVAGMVMDRWHFHKSFVSALLYGVLSLLMTLLNKVVITRFFFDYPTVIMMLQMAVALFTMELARMIGLLKIQPYTFERGKDMLLPSLIYCFHCYFSLTALEGMSLPMYGAIKRCVPVLTLYLGVAVLKKQKPSRGIVVSVLLISAGAFLASVYDFMMDGWSYLYGSLSVVCQASYLILIERLALTSQYTPVELMYMNSFNGLVFFLLADMIQDEIRDAFMYFLTATSTLFWLCFGALLVSGALLNFALFLCTVYNSALATSLVGDVKAVVQTFIGYALGFFIFFDVIPHLSNLIGVGVNVVGCFLYTYIRTTESDTRRTLDSRPNRL